MLINTKTLTGYKWRSLDGNIGKAKEFYFDDRHWTVRYLIISTQNWLPDKKFGFNEMDSTRELGRVESFY